MGTPVRRRLATAIAGLVLVASSAMAGPARAVINGEASEQGQFPFVVALTEPDGAMRCSGSVIARRWILTAAHCVQDPETGVRTAPDELVVVAGSNDRTTGTRHAIRAIVVHPKLVVEFPDINDVALLRLARPTTAPRVTLPRVGEDSLEKPGTRLVAAGFGAIDPVGLVTVPEMRHTEMEAVSDPDCKASWESPPFLYRFSAPDHLCSTELLTGVCPGDSGGPLFGSLGGKFVQVGVAHGVYGPTCGTSTHPDLWMEVNSVPIRTWIKQVTGV